MTNTQSYRRGDVLLADLPFADAVGSKVRPVLVVQNDVANKLRNNLIVVVFSSRIPSRVLPTQYHLRANSALAKKAGLKRDSVVDCGVIYTISTNRIRRQLGSFTDEAMAVVDHCLELSLSLV